MQGSSRGSEERKRTMQQNNRQLIKISGEVDAIQHKSKDSGFAVIILLHDGKLETVVGEFGDIEAGEDIICTGYYSTHRLYGEQFRCVLCERALPTTENNIIKYLGGGSFDGVDMRIAKKIVREFGDQTFSVIENECERLCDIDGIDGKCAKKISEKFVKTYAVRSLINTLSEYSLPTGVAVRTWKALGDNAEAVFLSDPYVLTREEIGVSFEQTDNIAARRGLDPASDKRIAAGIRYIMKRFENDGHSAVPLEALKQECCAFLGIDSLKFGSVLDSELGENNLYLYYKGREAFVMTADLYTAEEYISRRLSIMSEMSYDNEVDFSEVIDIAEEENGIEYEQKQREAINLALSKGFLILTGGPGTGKTTTLNAILSLFEQQDMEVMLAAPTGKAAKRLAEITGHEAKTIHRLLEVKPPEGNKISFIHNENDPLSCDVLIIDEMSMVDSRLFEAVLRAISVTCKLLLVGDYDQLPSVGAGNVLRDIIDSGVMPVVKLTEIYRQAQQSLIVTTAHKIIHGEQPDLTDRSGDFFFMERRDFNEARQLAVDLCKTRLPDTYGYDPMNDIQVLSPTRQGPVGTHELNRLLQEQLNPKTAGRSEVEMPFGIFRKGDKVMQTHNDYDILWKKKKEDGSIEEGAGIFNGDIGIVTAANKVLRTLTVDFDGRTANYSADQINELELAYAVTVHKSQGSEYEAVVLLLPEGYEMLCYRNLLYTGVTRAKKLLVVIGSVRQFRRMIDNDRKTLRYTCLKEMILENEKDDSNE